MTALADVELVEAFDLPGVIAFTTTRARGDFSIIGQEPARSVTSRWLALQNELGVARFAFAKQVHGDHVIVHGDNWSGWLRAAEGDGHIALSSGTALAVTLADCVPVFLAHPRGVVGLLHAGWRGVAVGIVTQAARQLEKAGFRLADCRAHLGPAICGACYEVGPEVVLALRGEKQSGPAHVDLRELLGGQLQQHGVTNVSASAFCTRHHNERFFSHRAGDTGRHIGVIARVA